MLNSFYMITVIQPWMLIPCVHVCLHAESNKMKITFV